MSRQTLTTDVVIIGAGIGGLWLHHRLNNMGFHSLLLESNMIGNAQTLSSQGIIHGGSKYALNGILSKASQAISSMPSRWKDCLTGEGEIDLSLVNVLAYHQLLWSKEQLSSKMVSFFASKALSSRMQTVANEEDRPDLFRHPDFKGALYQLDEPVLDIPSVLKSLAQPWQDRILKISSDAPITWKQKQGMVTAIHLDDEIEIQAQHFVLTAGEGNENLLQSLGVNKPVMQRRPLQMVLCKAKNKQLALPAIYAHSLGSGSKPIATITSHYTEDGNVVWYIGGNIAEQGVGKTGQQLTTEATDLLHDILPWFELPELEWATHKVNRAEPKQSALSRPDTAFVESRNNIHIAWPTKLALAPDLADRVIMQLQKENLQAGQHKTVASLPSAVIGKPLWDKAFQ
ncbi:MAG: FAD-dependent oxidoreductase [Gammaproteobacteria bacterium]|nr:FAD-dependent oxidoreductase [Gammaproteobacteria bacterium]MDH5592273.1 FAD-dependent oxidoreductase [Gammaproteobacteria bacterium]